MLEFLLILAAIPFALYGLYIALVIAFFLISIVAGVIAMIFMPKK